MTAPEVPAAPRWRRRLKKILLTLVVLLVLLLTGAWLGIPAIVGSDWGREKVRAALSEALGRPVAVAGLTFGWSSGLTVSGFALGEGDDALRARSLSADPELLSLLGDETRLRRISVDGLDLVVVRRADGSYRFPALEPIPKEADAPADPEGKELARLLGGLSVELAMTEVRLLVRDEVGGELLRFGPVSASAVIAPGDDRIPVRFSSKEEGFDVTADLELLEDGRMREAPIVVGTLSFTGMDLARYARIAAVVGSTEGLAGHLTGKIDFRVSGADRQSVELDLTLRDAGAASIALAGEGRLTGSVERTGEAIASSGFVLAVPGGSLRLEELKKDGDRISAHARLDADVPALRAALRGVDLPPGPVGSAELVLSAELAGSEWSVRIDGGAAAAPGRPLADVLPGLGDRIVFAGKVAGDRELAAVRIVEPLVFSAGPESITVTGEIRDPKSNDRHGRFEAAVEGPLLKPAIDSLADTRMEGRAEGALVLSLAGGRAELSGELAVVDLVLSGPGVPEVREPRVSLRPAASYAFADGRITVTNAAIAAQGLGVSLTGQVEGSAGTRTGKGKLVLTGDLARIRPFLPAGSDLVPAGTLRADLDLGGDASQVRASGTATLAGLDLGGGRRVGDVGTTVDATYRVGERELAVARLRVESAPATAEFSGRVSLAGDTPSATGAGKVTGDLARIPAGFLPAGFAGRGAVTATLDLAEPTRGRLSVTGEGLVLTGVPGIAGEVREDRVVAEADLLWPRGASLPRVGDGRIVTPAASVAWTGILDPAGASELAAGVTVSLPMLVRDHPGLFPEGLVATGVATAKLNLAGDLATSKVLDLVTGSAEVALARAAWTGYEVTGGTIALTLDRKRVRITKGEAMLNGGPVRFGGGADLGADPLTYDFAVDTRGVKLSRTMEPQAKYLVPLFGSAAQLSGLVALKTDLGTSGAGGDSLLDGLTGTASVKVSDGAIRGSPLLSAILGWLGEPEDLKFTSIGGNLRFDKGRVGTDDLLLTAANVTIRLQGSTGFDGTLDYKLGVKLPENSKQAARFQAVLGGDGFIPIRLGGTFTAPKLKPPDLKDVAGGVLEGVLKKKLEDLLRPR